MDTYALAVQQLKKAIENAIEKAISNGELPQAEAAPFIIETPADRSHGDFATNAAMAGAKAFRMPPFKIAQAITSNLDLEGTMFDRFETAGPGFINFFLGTEFYSAVIREILANPEAYGRSEYGRDEKVMVEFVSANPTGPMHMGNARGGALGDCLAAVLDKAGYNAWREFYVNDAGNQIEKFGCSLEARYLQIFKGDEIEFPEDGYQGEDIKDLAKEYADLNGDSLVNVSAEVRKKALVDYALPKNIKKMQADMEKYKIFYDKWFFESELHKSGAVKAVVDLLTKIGLTYEKDGALWFKTTEFGDEKDRVLVRENGVPTYLVPDIAYHYNKLAVRKFDKAVDIFGADHHGYIARIKASMTALGVDADRLDIVIMQMVNLVRNGEKYKLSKRSGKAITLSTLLDEIPIDAARFFFNLREPNSHFDFDLDLAVSQTSQNPVYYVQYAHARICSVLKKMNEEGIEVKSLDKAALSVLTAPEEQEMIKHLATLPNVINDAAKAYDPAKVTKYVIDLATMYHKFYNNCRIMGEDESVMQARLSLSLAVKQVIKNILDMLKITCPESM